MMQYINPYWARWDMGDPNVFTQTSTLVNVNVPTSNVVPNDWTRSAQKAKARKMWEEQHKRDLKNAVMGPKKARWR